MNVIHLSAPLSRQRPEGPRPSRSYPPRALRVMTNNTFTGICSKTAAEDVAVKNAIALLGSIPNAVLIGGAPLALLAGAKQEDFPLPGIAATPEDWDVFVPCGNSSSRLIDAAAKATQALDSIGAKVWPAEDISCQYEALGAIKGVTPPADRVFEYEIVLHPARTSADLLTAMDNALSEVWAIPEGDRLAIHVSDLFRKALVHRVLPFYHGHFLGTHADRMRQKFPDFWPIYVDRGQQQSSDDAAAFDDDSIPF